MPTNTAIVNDVNDTLIPIRQSESGTVQKIQTKPIIVNTIATWNINFKVMLFKNLKTI